MTKTEIYENLIIPSLLDCFPLKKSDISMSSKFKKDLRLDSLDMLDLLCDIEEKHGQTLVDTEEEKKEFFSAVNGTVSDLVNVIYSCIERRSSNGN